LEEILVDRPSVPIPFPGDRPTECHVDGKASTVLNLLFARTLLAAEVSVLKDGNCIDVPGHCEVVLLFALAGRAALSWEGHRAEINAGDAALFQPRCGVAARVGIDGHGARVYKAELRRVIDGPAN
jgi:environmental stress-induced protein Ves